MSDDTIKTEGTVLEILPGTRFKVELPNSNIVTGHLSGKMRQHFIKIVPGDKVKLDMSKYDLSKCRITFRMKA